VPLSTAHQIGIDSEHPNQAQSTARDQAILTFATLQFASLIYLQKFAFFAHSSGSVNGRLIAADDFSVPVELVIMSAGVGWMVLFRHFTVVPSRLAVFLVFLGFCMFSEAFAVGSSAPSFGELILLYASTIVCANLSDGLYIKILNRFIMLMILPAGIMIVQYVYQKATGLSDPLNLEALFPIKSLLMPGFYYNSHYPWNSNFSRPNGFFFLEPSMASAYTASAAILEISYFRRRWCIILMVAATVLSMGATGIMMLVIAAPFLLSRESPMVAASAVIAAVATLTVMFMLDIPLPMMSRAEELQNADSSGGQRMAVPAADLEMLLFDPTFIFIGNGAGSTPTTIGQVWALAKLLREYGLLAMTSFLMLYLLGVSRPSNVPLKVSLSMTYFVSGGYLLQPALVNMLILFFFILIPEENIPATGRVRRDSRWRPPGSIAGA